MPDPQIAPYGSWKSPITSDLVVAGDITLAQVMIDGRDVYWTELRPAQGGKLILVRRTPDGQVADVTSPPFNVRTRVHEYGGGAYVASEGTVFFSNYDDQRLYRLDPSSEPGSISPAVDMRYADAVVDRRRGLIYAVREDHTVEGEAANTLVSLSVDGDESGGRAIVSGNDFYAAPRLSPDGSRLAWLTWSHPNMPWDGTELWVGELREDGSVGSSRRVAGGGEDAIVQPEWSPDGVLHFISDRTGWWNLYRLREDRAEPLCEMEAEFGRPMWNFRMSSYGFESANRIICSYTAEGIWRLGSLDTASLELTPLDVPYTDISFVRAAPGFAAFVGGSPTEPPAVVLLDVASGRVDVVRPSADVEIDPGYISTPEPVEFPTESGLIAHALFYPPKNRDYAAPPGELPPLRVLSHGGPTSATDGTLDLDKQYWTSRGFAVLDVNYGGSTGYGTEYRRRLNGQWGVVDVDDCTNGAKYLVERGLADGERLAIAGGSAGGYTTLCALTFRDLFKAGASYFGVSELEIFAKDTHKFESRYLDRLVGPYPERKDLYYERSAINFTDRLSAPVIFFQGLEDKVVPPNQAEMMVDALRAKGVPVAYIPFEGEQHGFRRAENIKRTLDAELYFYSRIFGFAPADDIEPVEIENLDE
jgi:dipeptidyl aminopeptidase/acylaminoacyl peptidase